MPTDGKDKNKWIEDLLPLQELRSISPWLMIYIHGSNIEQGIIMVCTPDLYYQEFKFSGLTLRGKIHGNSERGF